MHKLYEPIKDKLDAYYLAIGMDQYIMEMIWAYQTETDSSLIFKNGRINFYDDHLTLAVRVPIELDFKFDVLLGNSEISTVEQKRAADSISYIYYIRLEIDRSDIVDIIGELVAASTM